MSEKKSNTPSTRWNDLIEELKHWPSSEPEWEDAEVQGFVYKVQSIAGQKCRERINAGRFELHQSIVLILEKHRSELVVFDVDEPILSTWTAENCAIEFVAELTELLKRLASELEQRAGLVSSKPKDFKERHMNMKELSDLEKTIYNLVKQVIQGFEGFKGFKVTDHIEEPNTGKSSTSESVTTEDSEVKQVSDEEHKSDIEKGDTIGIQGESSGPTVEQGDVETPTELTEPTHHQVEDSQVTEQGGNHVESYESESDDVAQDFVNPPIESTPGSLTGQEHLPQTSIKVTSSGSEPISDGSPVDQLESDTDSVGNLKPQPRPRPSISDKEHRIVVGTKADSIKGQMVTSTGVDSGDIDWETIVWGLLVNDDWTGAYWLARSLKSQGYNPSVPHELLAVLQGARWLEYDRDLFVTDIQQIASKWSPQKKNSQRLLGVAAALRPCLIAPHPGLVGWLPRKDDINPSLGTLCEVIREFASSSYPLRIQDIRGIAGKATRGQAIEDLTLKARAFLRDNLEHRLMFQRATKVLHRLVRKGGDLYTLLSPVTKNYPEQVDRVRHLMSELSERKQIVDRIDQIDRDKPHLKPIVGSSINQLVRIVEDAVGIARHWCDLNEQEFGLRQRGDWWDKHVNGLLDGLKETIPKVEGELDSMVESNHSKEEVALGHVLKHSVGQVTEMLGIDSTHIETGSNAWMRENCTSLEEALTRRLLYIPEISIDEEGNPVSDRESEIAEILRQSIENNRSLREATDLWIEQQDFRFTEVLLGALDDDGIMREYETKCHDALKQSRMQLKNEVSRVRSAIEKGIVDGLLNEEERVTFSNELEVAATDDPLHFEPLFGQLMNIDQQLIHKLKDRMQSLNLQWDGYKDRLKESNEIGTQLEVVAEFFKNASANCDTRVMEEGLARVQEFFQAGYEWKKEWFDPPQTSDVLNEFREATPDIEAGLGELSRFDDLTKKIIVQGETWKGMDFGAISESRRGEACDALSAWYRLKRRRWQQAENRRYVRTLMGYLGFHVSESESAIKLRKYGKEWFYCQVSASLSNIACPIPQLGSQANGRYEVVCMTERSGAASIRATLSELKLDTTTVVVFYLGRLSEKQRHNIASMAKNNDMTLALLDEILLVHLSGLDDNRLPDFIRCSLPYAAFNPYMPFQAGNVPPEMFYGRDEMIRQLQNEGSCMVYGGRQLGKSALLRQVEREFHMPERGQYAWVEDIKLIGEVTSGVHPTKLWLRLRDGFKRDSLLSSKVTTTQPEGIIRHIRNVMSESAQRRVMVLFDEADNFLGADAQNSFQVVEGLRSLMQDTQLRFKVVFAGLHDVQRFYNIANQPLAHFGPNLRMGPLEPGPAQELVRVPLEALGYRFVDDTTVLKVLSYTNYHPGLIQYFCYELVRRLKSKKPNIGPPYKVSSNDVEAVYGSLQVRTVIRERLDWTLALDPRYQCIAWTMICEQKEQRNTPVHSISVDSLLQLVRYWWKEGFKEVDTGALRILLEEMVGLGVLSQRSENEYQLRSPNLVRLMGTEEVIESKLIDLAEKPFPPQFQPTSNHSPLDHKKGAYSPLTLEQEGRIKESQESGVTLIFGSRALGIAELDEIFGNMENSELIPPKNLTRRDLPDKWMVAISRKKKAHDHLLAYGRLTGTGDDMAKCVWNAWQKCEEFKTKESRPMRVVFILDPGATWSWLKSSKIEVKVETLSLKRWDEAGIQQRLKQADKLDSMDVCKEVRKGTGGWPVLLDNLFERCINLDDPRTCIDSLTKEIDSRESSLSVTLIHEVGLDPRISPTRVFKTMAAYGKIPNQELDTLAELVEGTPSLSPDECKLAVEYLSRMGCVDIINGEYKVDSVVARTVDLL